MQKANELRNDQQQQVQQAAEAEAVQAPTAASKTASVRDLLTVHQLIDLTDRPIQMAREHLGWWRVRASASNCICCCANGSITLVTTNDSYMLDHIPLDDIQAAEASPSLAHLAMSNRRELAIIDLVESSIAGSSSLGPSLGGVASRLRASTKLVNLAAAGLSIAEVLLWRWIDESVLAILSQESLYTCQVDQARISHPAASALGPSSQLLSIEKICDLHPSLSGFCQITGIQRDQSSNLYAITALYLPGDYLKWMPAELRAAPQQAGPISVASRRIANLKSSSLKHSFSSVPGRLSQLASNEHSFDSLASVEKYTDLNNNTQASTHSEETFGNEVCGLVQIHCRLRQRSQVIPAQAAAFASTYGSCDTTEPPRTTLIVANRAEDRLRVHFISMATTRDLTTSGQNAAPSKRMSGLPGDNKFDFPTSIVCCPLDQSQSRTTTEEVSHQLAMVATKYGQLFVCSIQLGTILFSVRVTHDVISSTVMDSRTGGLMAICRSGQVILLQVEREKVSKLMEDKSSRPPPSSMTLDSFRLANWPRTKATRRHASSDSISSQINSINIGLNVTESTRF